MSRTTIDRLIINAPYEEPQMFAVEDIEGVLARLQTHGARLVGEVEQYEAMYRRGSEGVMIALPSGSGEALERHRWIQTTRERCLR